VLCAYLSVRREDLFGTETVESWPTVTLYQDTKKLRRRVLKELSAYRDSLSAAVAPAQKEVKLLERKGSAEHRRKNAPLGEENLLPSGPSPMKSKPRIHAKLPTVGPQDETFSSGGKSRSQPTLLGSLANRINSVM
jgi:hypothetical protein